MLFSVFSPIWSNFHQRNDSKLQRVNRTLKLLGKKKSKMTTPRFVYSFPVFQNVISQKPPQNPPTQKRDNHLFMTEYDYVIHLKQLSLLEAIKKPIFQQKLNKYFIHFNVIVMRKSFLIWFILYRLLLSENLIKDYSGFSLHLLLSFCLASIQCSRLLHNFLWH